MRCASSTVRRYQVLLAHLALVGIAFLIEIGLLSDSLGAAGTPPEAFTLGLSAVASLLLVFYPRAPLAVLASVLVIEGVLAAAGSYPGGAPAIVALGAVAIVEERRRSIPALVVTAIVLQVSSISSIPVSVMAWGIGAYAQTRFRYVAELAERTGQLEREREQRDVIAAQAERAAITRELHDIIAHSVTVMLLGVRGARDTLRTDPDLAEEALRRVEKSGEESIIDLRRMLSVLRESSEVALTPSPTIKQIPELVRQYADSGMPVTLTTDGETRPTDAGIELTAYRIVQEGLTNVARHADRPSQVDVLITFVEGWLEVSVADNGVNEGRASPGIGTGSGIRGLRERVVAVGGILTTQEPLPKNGFQITGRLPLPGEEPA
jgi:signal transduction histidine kinase